MVNPSPPATVLAAWGKGPGDEVRPLGGGRVNQTWAVGEPTQLVLQHLSNHYFADPQLVMDNLARIIGHLEWRQAFSDRSAPRWYPQLEPTAAGRAFHVDSDGRVWRAFRYIEGFVIGEKSDASAIRSIAQMYGRFIAAVDDLDGVPLAQTVPEFRSMQQIVAAFDDAWDQASPERRSAIADVRERAKALTESVGPDDPTLPLRVVHNDTKLPNVVLFGDPAVARAVIDFDLVMPGQVMNDFGDLCRSALQHGGGGFDGDLVATIAAAFIDGCNGVLAEPELDSLSQGPQRICAQLAWRYLADTLRASPVLRVADPSASLRKAEANIHLAEQLVGNRDSIRAVIDRLM